MTLDVYAARTTKADQAVGQLIDDLLDNPGTRADLALRSSFAASPGSSGTRPSSEAELSHPASHRSLKLTSQASCKALPGPRWHLRARRDEPACVGRDATTFEAAPAPTSSTTGDVIVESNRIAPCQQ